MSTQDEMDAAYRRLYEDDPGLALKGPGYRAWVMATFCEGPEVLDMGCGLGDLMLVLQQTRPRWRVVGADISVYALELARSRAIRGELIHTEEVPAGPWQTIALGQVLEHLDDDAAMIRATMEALRPSGLLVVSVPFEDQVKSADHRREYTKDNLWDLLHEAGGIPWLVEWPGMATRMIMKARKA